MPENRMILKPCNIGPTNLYDKFDLVWGKIGRFTNRRLQTRTSTGLVRGAVRR